MEFGGRELLPFLLLWLGHFFRAVFGWKLLAVVLLMVVFFWFCSLFQGTEAQKCMIRCKSDDGLLAVVSVSWRQRDRRGIPPWIVRNATFASGMEGPSLIGRI